MQKFFCAFLSIVLTAGLAVADAPSGTVEKAEKPRRVVLFDGKTLREIFAPKSSKPTQISYSREWIDQLPRVKDERRDAEWQCALAGARPARRRRGLRVLHRRARRDHGWHGGAVRAGGARR